VAIEAGERKPRPNYAHTARNSAKRNPNGPRGSKFGKAALRRKAEASQMGDVSPDPVAPTDSTPPPPVDRGTDWLTPQLQLEPREPNNRLPAVSTHLPYPSRLHSVAESMTTFSEM